MDRGSLRHEHQETLSALLFSPPLLRSSRGWRWQQRDGMGLSGGGGTRNLATGEFRRLVALHQDTREKNPNDEPQPFLREIYPKMNPCPVCSQLAEGQGVGGGSEANTRSRRRRQFHHPHRRARTGDLESPRPRLRRLRLPPPPQAPRRVVPLLVVTSGSPHCGKVPDRRLDLN